MSKIKKLCNRCSILNLLDNKYPMSIINPPKCSMFPKETLWWQDNNGKAEIFRPSACRHYRGVKCQR
jgi:hypothetical protein